MMQKAKDVAEKLTRKGDEPTGSEQAPHATDISAPGAIQAKDKRCGKLPVQPPEGVNLENKNTVKDHSAGPVYDL